MSEDLFKALDLDKDGWLSREELHEAAVRLGWGWRHAPLLAVLDLLTVPGPLTQTVFVDRVREILADENGPYGRILLRSPVPWKPVPRIPCPAPLQNGADRDEKAGGRPPADGNRDDGGEKEDLVSMLRRTAGPAAADRYEMFLEEVRSPGGPVNPDKTALLLIDPQRSFTSGVWMRSIGPGAEEQVMPIRLAFRNCARLLKETKGRIETLFSRCPFPPESYDWDDQIGGAVHAAQLYFVKPGNSILWPPTNGFQDWVKGLLVRGKTRLVIGGCTLNSCVRVSAIEVQERFAGSGLQVVVDLDLCGGRTRNYMGSPEFGGLSSVESAVREMVSVGVRVSPCLMWP